MPELKIAIALSGVRMPFKKALHTAAKMGASGIEIDARNGIQPSEISDTGRRQILKMLTDLNLTVAAVRYPTRRGYDVIDDLDRRLEATKQAMTFAYSLGARIVINAVGIVPEDDQHPARSQLLASLTDLARHGERVGAVLACETGSEPCPVLVRLLDQVPGGSLGIHFNPARLILANHYTPQDIRICAHYVRSVAARDAVRDFSQRRGIEVKVGRGSAEFPEILGVLEEHRFNGWFVLERAGAGDAIQEMSDALAYLRAL
ncbi:MAG: sugar phosphate isomerase/epimerase [Pirellulaceae bacterium]|nr:sugar phosphate isomerase/epimerase [Pirellulaceae bacterium]